MSTGLLLSDNLLDYISLHYGFLSCWTDLRNINGLHWGDCFCGRAGVCSKLSLWLISLPSILAYGNDRALAKMLLSVSVWLPGLFQTFPPFNVISLPETQFIYYRLHFLAHWNTFMKLRALFTFLSRM